MDDKYSQLFTDLIKQYLFCNYSFLEKYKITYSLNNEVIGTIPALDYIKKFDLNGNVRVSYIIKINRK
ncbi:MULTISPECIES: hypothetical protein [Psychrilyobacter]|uniref:Uncharacterized protein n=1 Tax=Psychrilyobacter piezotolerans TaxID=2293438 RepID=A0ABX9KJM6_9FUSO|nr:MULTISPECIES: hypothetical protein [Psychrilyobacter]MCS5421231.1 hypothetical protein [Psychrilyobacter sp. S5]NDI77012.1 hypothetical protein [Psychrilyobacter piezotolerans]RDE64629.1 hypothetical protein DV867_03550 [Psychrilyobacter sp. S5]REI42441.1 hypothetical protein DYH56_03550 [Psychrilyobacter piezotolerans]